MGRVGMVDSVVHMATITECKHTSHIRKHSPKVTYVSIGHKMLTVAPSKHSSVKNILTFPAACWATLCTALCMQGVCPSQHWAGIYANVLFNRVIAHILHNEPVAMLPVKH